MNGAAVRPFAGRTAPTWFACYAINVGAGMPAKQATQVPDLIRVQALVRARSASLAKGLSV